MRWARQQRGLLEGTGYRLLMQGDDAFQARINSARQAQQRICVQTYLWHDDESGRELMAELLQAAERGVDVYLLLDDMDVRGNDHALALLDQHPQIHIRLFNPFRFRWGVIHAFVELILRGSELNHRMHNKAWLVDGEFAIVGGRNIGDAYFDRSPASNFVDLDVSILGTEARAAEQSFWSYWEHALARPIAQLRRLQKAAKAWQRHPVWQRLQNLPELEDDLQQPRAQTTTRFEAADFNWNIDSQFIADDCDKISAPTQRKDAGVLEAILFRFARVKRKLWVISPYFSPGAEGVTALAELVARGVDVRIMTNSLASNDVLIAHGSYAQHRVALLRAGVKLYELKAMRSGTGAKEGARIRVGSSKASLHTKAIVIDEDEVFIGSFNLSPRSALINTELGVFLHDKDFTKKVAQHFSLSNALRSCYRVRLIADRLHWQGRINGHAVCYHREPDTRWWRRACAWIAQKLPLESQI